MIALNVTSIYWWKCQINNTDGKNKTNLNVLLNVKFVMFSLCSLKGYYVLLYQQSLVQ